MFADTIVSDTLLQESSECTNIGSPRSQKQLHKRPTSGQSSKSMHSAFDIHGNTNGNGENHQTIEYPDGCRYVGDVNSNGVRHGRGTLYFPNGDKYKGDYKDNEKEGRGAYYFADGSKYKGNHKTRFLDWLRNLLLVLGILVNSRF
jgi:hypothetical protein